MEFIHQDLPEHAHQILRAVQLNPHLAEACQDYQRLRKRLAQSPIDSNEVSHINEILVELRAEIIRLVSQSSATMGRTHNE